ncbi:hypothetical protein F4819DRAFT_498709 [Hypoxylon fuscum]|nr:hypothetical protein F4819DRAFT_498709 [Hypoxylon fuscum]
MRLCKALLCRSARRGQPRTLAPPCFSRRYFADRAQQQHSEESPTPPRANPGSPRIPLDSEGDDSFHINPEKKTVDTAVGELPLSPVMDPMFWEARGRHQVPKAKPGKPQSSIERQIRANPFAKALATPVRMCALTRTRLPSFFLQDFNVVAHPETDRPWLIPHSLLPEEPSKAKEDTEISEAIHEEIQKSTEDANSTAAASTGDELPQGPSTYVLARKDLLSSISVKGSGYERAAAFITGASPRYRHLAGKAVWRADMDTYMLDLLRRDVVADLLYLSRLCTDEARHYVVKCWGWDDVQHKHKGAVLWFGEPAENAASGSDQKTTASRDEPGLFATFDFQRTDTHGKTSTTGVAVHNMPVLLGPEQAARVRQEATALKDGAIFMLAGRRTAKLQLKLWKLQGYLADYRDVP